MKDSAQTDDVVNDAAVSAMLAPVRGGTAENVNFDAEDGSPYMLPLRSQPATARMRLLAVDLLLSMLMAGGFQLRGGEADVALPSDGGSVWRTCTLVAVAGNQLQVFVPSLGRHRVIPLRFLAIKNILVDSSDGLFLDSEHGLVWEDDLLYTQLGTLPDTAGALEENVRPERATEATTNLHLLADSFADILTAQERSAVQDTARLTSQRASLAGHILDLQPSDQKRAHASPPPQTPDQTPMSKQSLCEYDFNAYNIFLGCDTLVDLSLSSSDSGDSCGSCADGCNALNAPQDAANFFTSGCTSGSESTADIVADIPASIGGLLVGSRSESCLALESPTPSYSTETLRQDTAEHPCSTPSSAPLFDDGEHATSPHGHRLLNIQEYLGVDDGVLRRVFVRLHGLRRDRNKLLDSITLFQALAISHASQRPEYQDTRTAKLLDTLLRVRIPGAPAPQEHDDAPCLDILNSASITQTQARAFASPLLDCVPNRSAPSDSFAPDAASEAHGTPAVSAGDTQTAAATRHHARTRVLADNHRKREMQRVADLIRSEHARQEKIQVLLTCSLHGYGIHVTEPGGTFTSKRLMALLGKTADSDRSASCVLLPEGKHPSAGDTSIGVPRVQANRRIVRRLSDELIATRSQLLALRVQQLRIFNRFADHLPTAKGRYSIVQRLTEHALCALETGFSRAFGLRAGQPKHDASAEFSSLADEFTAQASIVEAQMCILQQARQSTEHPLHWCCMRLSELAFASWRSFRVYSIPRFSRERRLAFEAAARGITHKKFITGTGEIVTLYNRILRVIGDHMPYLHVLPAIFSGEAARSAIVPTLKPYVARGMIFTQEQAAVAAADRQQRADSLRLALLAQHERSKVPVVTLEAGMLSLASDISDASADTDDKEPPRVQQVHRTLGMSAMDYLHGEYLRKQALERTAAHRARRSLQRYISHEEKQRRLTADYSVAPDILQGSDGGATQIFCTVAEGSCFLRRADAALTNAFVLLYEVLYPYIHEEILDHYAIHARALADGRLRVRQRQGCGPLSAAVVRQEHERALAELREGYTRLMKSVEIFFYRALSDFRTGMAIPRWTLVILALLRGADRLSFVAEAAHPCVYDGEARSNTGPLHTVYEVSGAQRQKSATTAPDGAAHDCSVDALLREAALQPMRPHAVMQTVVHARPVLDTRGRLHSAVSTFLRAVLRWPNGHSFLLHAATDIELLDLNREAATPMTSADCAEALRDLEGVHFCMSMGLEDGGTFTPVRLSPSTDEIARLLPAFFYDLVDFYTTMPQFYDDILIRNMAEKAQAAQDSSARVQACVDGIAATPLEENIVIGPVPAQGDSSPADAFAREYKRKLGALSGSEEPPGGTRVDSSSGAQAAPSGGDDGSSSAISPGFQPHLQHTVPSGFKSSAFSHVGLAAFKAETLYKQRTEDYFASTDPRSSTNDEGLYSRQTLRARTEPFSFTLRVLKLTQRVCASMRSYLEPFEGFFAIFVDMHARCTQHLLEIDALLPAEFCTLHPTVNQLLRSLKHTASKLQRGASPGTEASTQPSAEEPISSHIVEVLAAISQFLRSDDIVDAAVAGYAVGGAPPYILEQILSFSVGDSADAPSSNGYAADLLLLMAQVYDSVWSLAPLPTKAYYSVCPVDFGRVLATLTRALTAVFDSLCERLGDYVRLAGRIAKQCVLRLSEQIIHSCLSSVQQMGGVFIMLKGFARLYPMWQGFFAGLDHCACCLEQLPLIGSVHSLYADVMDSRVSCSHVLLRSVRSVPRVSHVMKAAHEAFNALVGALQEWAQLLYSRILLRAQEYFALQPGDFDMTAANSDGFAQRFPLMSSNILLPRPFKLPEHSREAIDLTLIALEFERQCGLPLIHRDEDVSARIRRLDGDARLRRQSEEPQNGQAREAPGSPMRRYTVLKGGLASSASKAADTRYPDLSTGVNLFVRPARMQPQHISSAFLELEDITLKLRNMVERIYWCRREVLGLNFQPFCATDSETLLRSLLSQTGVDDVDVSVFAPAEFAGQFSFDGEVDREHTRQTRDGKYADILTIGKVYELTPGNLRYILSSVRLEESTLLSSVLSLQPAVSLATKLVVLSTELRANFATWQTLPVSQVEVQEVARSVVSTATAASRIITLFGADSSLAGISYDLLQFISRNRSFIHLMFLARCTLTGAQMMLHSGAHTSNSSRDLMVTKIPLLNNVLLPYSLEEHIAEGVALPGYAFHDPGNITPFVKKVLGRGPSGIASGATRVRVVVEFLRRFMPTIPVAMRAADPSCLCTALSKVTNEKLGLLPRAVEVSGEKPSTSLTFDAVFSLRDLLLDEHVSTDVPKGVRFYSRSLDDAVPVAPEAYANMSGCSIAFASGSQNQPPLKLWILDLEFSSRPMPSRRSTIYRLLVQGAAMLTTYPTSLLRHLHNFCCRQHDAAEIFGNWPPVEPSLPSNAAPFHSLYNELTASLETVVSLLLSGQLTVDTCISHLTLLRSLHQAYLLFCRLYYLLNRVSILSSLCLLERHEPVFSRTAARSSAAAEPEQTIWTSHPLITLNSAAAYSAMGTVYTVLSKLPDTSDDMVRIGITKASLTRQMRAVYHDSAQVLEKEVRNLAAINTSCPAGRLVHPSRCVAAMVDCVLYERLEAPIVRSPFSLGGNDSPDTAAYLPEDTLNSLQAEIVDGAIIHELPERTLASCSFVLEAFGFHAARFVVHRIVGLGNVSQYVVDGIIFRQLVPWPGDASPLDDYALSEGALADAARAAKGDVFASSTDRSLAYYMYKDTYETRPGDIGPSVLPPLSLSRAEGRHGFHVEFFKFFKPFTIKCLYHLFTELTYTDLIGFINLSVSHYVHSFNSCLTEASIGTRCVGHMLRAIPFPVTVLIINKYVQDTLRAVAHSSVQESAGLLAKLQAFLTVLRQCSSSFAEQSCVAFTRTYTELVSLSAITSLSAAIGSVGAAQDGDGNQDTSHGHDTVRAALGGSDDPALFPVYTADLVCAVESVLSDSEELPTASSAAQNDDSDPPSHTICDVGVPCSLQVLCSSVRIAQKSDVLYPLSIKPFIIMQDCYPTYKFKDINALVTYYSSVSTKLSRALSNSAIASPQGLTLLALAHTDLLESDYLSTGSGESACDDISPRVLGGYDTRLCSTLQRVFFSLDAAITGEQYSYSSYNIAHACILQRCYAAACKVDETRGSEVDGRNASNRRHLNGLPRNSSAALNDETREYGDPSCAASGYTALPPQSGQHVQPVQQQPPSGQSHCPVFYTLDYFRNRSATASSEPPHPTRTCTVTHAAAAPVLSPPNNLADSKKRRQGCALHDTTWSLLTMRVLGRYSSEPDCMEGSAPLASSLVDCLRSYSIAVLLTPAQDSYCGSNPRRLLHKYFASFPSLAINFVFYPCCDSLDDIMVPISLGATVVLYGLDFQTADSIPLLSLVALLDRIIFGCRGSLILWIPGLISLGTSPAIYSLAETAKQTLASLHLSESAQFLCRDTLPFEALRLSSGSSNSSLMLFSAMLSQVDGRKVHLLDTQTMQEVMSCGREGLLPCDILRMLFLLFARKNITALSFAKGSGSDMKEKVTTEGADTSDDLEKTIHTRMLSYQLSWLNHGNSSASAIQCSTAKKLFVGLFVAAFGALLLTAEEERKYSSLPEDARSNFLLITLSNLYDRSGDLCALSANLSNAFSVLPMNEQTIDRNDTAEYGFTQPLSDLKAQPYEYKTSPTKEVPPVCFNLTDAYLIAMQHLHSKRDALPRLQRSAEATLRSSSTLSCIPIAPSLTYDCHRLKYAHLFLEGQQPLELSIRNSAAAAVCAPRFVELFYKGYKGVHPAAVCPLNGRGWRIVGDLVFTLLNTRIRNLGIFTSGDSAHSWSHTALACAIRCFLTDVFEEEQALRIRKAMHSTQSALGKTERRAHTESADAGASGRTVRLTSAPQLAALHRLQGIIMDAPSVILVTSLQDMEMHTSGRPLLQPNTIYILIVPHAASSSERVLLGSILFQQDVPSARFVLISNDHGTTATYSHLLWSTADAPRSSGGTAGVICTSSLLCAFGSRLTVSKPESLHSLLNRHTKDLPIEPVFLEHVMRCSGRGEASLANLEKSMRFVRVFTLPMLDLCTSAFEITNILGVHALYMYQLVKLGLLVSVPHTLTVDALESSNLLLPSQLFEVSLDFVEALTLSADCQTKAIASLVAVLFGLAFSACKVSLLCCGNLERSCSPTGAWFFKFLDVKTYQRAYERLSQRVCLRTAPYSSVLETALSGYILHQGILLTDYADVLESCLPALQADDKRGLQTLFSMLYPTVLGNLPFLYSHYDAVYTLLNAVNLQSAECASSTNVFTSIVLKWTAIPYPELSASPRECADKDTDGGSQAVSSRDASLPPVTLSDLRSKIVKLAASNDSGNTSHVLASEGSLGSAPPGADLLNSLARYPVSDSTDLRVRTAELEAFVEGCTHNAKFITPGDECHHRAISFYIAAMAYMHVPSIVSSTVSPELCHLALLASLPLIHADAAVPAFSSTLKGNLGVCSSSAANPLLTKVCNMIFLPFTCAHPSDVSLFTARLLEFLDLRATKCMVAQGISQSGHTGEVYRYVAVATLRVVVHLRLAAALLDDASICDIVRGSIRTLDFQRVQRAYRLVNVSVIVEIVHVVPPSTVEVDGSPLAQGLLGAVPVSADSVDYLRRIREDRAALRVVGGVKELHNDYSCSSLLYALWHTAPLDIHSSSQGLLDRTFLAHLLLCPASLPAVHSLAHNVAASHVLRFLELTEDDKHACSFEAHVLAEVCSSFGVSALFSPEDHTTSHRQLEAVEVFVDKNLSPDADFGNLVGATFVSFSQLWKRLGVLPLAHAAESTAVVRQLIGLVNTSLVGQALNRSVLQRVCTTNGSSTPVQSSIAPLPAENTLCQETDLSVLFTGTMGTFPALSLARAVMLPMAIVHGNSSMPFDNIHGTVAACTGALVLSPFDDASAADHHNSTIIPISLQGGDSFKRPASSPICEDPVAAGIRLAIRIALGIRSQSASSKSSLRGSPQPSDTVQSSPESFNGLATEGGGEEHIYTSVGSCHEPDHFRDIPNVQSLTAYSMYNTTEFSSEGISKHLNSRPKCVFVTMPLSTLQSSGALSELCTWTSPGSTHLPFFSAAEVFGLLKQFGDGYGVTLPTVALLNVFCATRIVIIIYDDLPESESVLAMLPSHTHHITLHQYADISGVFEVLQPSEFKHHPSLSASSGCGASLVNPPRQLEVFFHMLHQTTSALASSSRGETTSHSVDSAVKHPPTKRINPILEPAVDSSQNAYDLSMKALYDVSYHKGRIQTLCSLLFEALSLQPSVCSKLYVWDATEGTVEGNTSSLPELPSSVRRRIHGEPTSDTQEAASIPDALSALKTLPSSRGRATLQELYCASSHTLMAMKGRCTLSNIITLALFIDEQLRRKHSARHATAAHMLHTSSRVLDQTTALLDSGLALLKEARSLRETLAVHREKLDLLSQYIEEVDAKVLGAEQRLHTATSDYDETKSSLDGVVDTRKAQLNESLNAVKALSRREFLDLLTEKRYTESFLPILKLILTHVYPCKLYTKEDFAANKDDLRRRLRTLYQPDEGDNMPNGSVDDAFPSRGYSIDNNFGVASDKYSGLISAVAAASTSDSSDSRGSIHALWSLVCGDFMGFRRGLIHFTDAENGFYTRKLGLAEVSAAAPLGGVELVLLTWYRAVLQYQEALRQTRRDGRLAMLRKTIPVHQQVYQQLKDEQDSVRSMRKTLKGAVESTTIRQGSVRIGMQRTEAARLAAAQLMARVLENVPVTVEEEHACRVQLSLCYVHSAITAVCIFYGMPVLPLVKRIIDLYMNSTLISKNLVFYGRTNMYGVHLHHGPERTVLLDKKLAVYKDIAERARIYRFDEDAIDVMAEATASLGDQDVAAPDYSALEPRPSTPVSHSDILQNELLVPTDNAQKSPERDGGTAAAQPKKHSKQLRASPDRKVIIDAVGGGKVQPDGGKPQSQMAANTFEPNRRIGIVAPINTSKAPLISMGNLTSKRKDENKQSACTAQEFTGQNTTAEVSEKQAEAPQHASDECAEAHDSLTDSPVRAPLDPATTLQVEYRVCPFCLSEVPLGTNAQLHLSFNSHLNVCNACKSCQCFCECAIFEGSHAQLSRLPPDQVYIMSLTRAVEKRDAVINFISTVCEHSLARVDAILYCLLAGNQQIAEFLNLTILTKAFPASLVFVSSLALRDTGLILQADSKPHMNRVSSVDTSLRTNSRDDLPTVLSDFLQAHYANTSICKIVDIGKDTPLFFQTLGAALRSKETRGVIFTVSSQNETCISAIRQLLMLKTRDCVSVPGSSSYLPAQDSSGLLKTIFFDDIRLSLARDISEYAFFCTSNSCAADAPTLLSLPIIYSLPSLQRARHLSLYDCLLTGSSVFSKSPAVRQAEMAEITASMTTHRSLLFHQYLEMFAPNYHNELLSAKITLQQDKKNIRDVQQNVIQIGQTLSSGMYTDAAELLVHSFDLVADSYARDRVATATTLRLVLLRKDLEKSSSSGAMLAVRAALSLLNYLCRLSLEKPALVDIFRRVSDWGLIGSASSFPLLRGEENLYSYNSDIQAAISASFFTEECVASGLAKSYDTSFCTILLFNCILVIAVSVGLLSDSDLAFIAAAISLSNAYTTQSLSVLYQFADTLQECTAEGVDLTPNVSLRIRILHVANLLPRCKNSENILDTLNKFLSSVRPSLCDILSTCSQSNMCQALESNESSKSIIISRNPYLTLESLRVDIEKSDVGLTNTALTSGLSLEPCTQDHASSATLYKSHLFSQSFCQHGDNQKIEFPAGSLTGIEHNAPLRHIRLVANQSVAELQSVFRSKNTLRHLRSQEHESVVLLIDERTLVSPVSLGALHNTLVQVPEMGIFSAQVSLENRLALQCQNGVSEFLLLLLLPDSSALNRPSTRLAASITAPLVVMLQIHDALYETMHHIVRRVVDFCNTNEDFCRIHDSMIKKYLNSPATHPEQLLVTLLTSSYITYAAPFFVSLLGSPLLSIEIRTDLARLAFLSHVFLTRTPMTPATTLREMVGIAVSSLFNENIVSVISAPYSSVTHQHPASTPPSISRPLLTDTSNLLAALPAVILCRPLLNRQIDNLLPRVLLSEYVQAFIRSSGVSMLVLDHLDLSSWTVASPEHLVVHTLASLLHNASSPSDRRLLSCSIGESDVHADEALHLTPHACIRLGNTRIHTAVAFGSVVSHIEPFQN